MPIVYREAKPSDLDFVIDTWVSSFQHSKTAGILGVDSYRDAMIPEIKRILSRDGVELYVAANPNVKPGWTIDVHGWIAIERGFRLPTRRKVERRWRRVMVRSDAPLVHYCYVKKRYRKHGLARGLFRMAEVDPVERFYYSCSTVLENEVKRAGKITGGRWDPSIQRYPRDHKPERTYECDTSSASSVQ